MYYVLPCCDASRTAIILSFKLIVNVLLLIDWDGLCVLMALMLIRSLLLWSFLSSCAGFIVKKIRLVLPSLSAFFRMGGLSATGLWLVCLQVFSTLIYAVIIRAWWSFALRVTGVEDIVWIFAFHLVFLICPVTCFKTRNDCPFDSAWHYRWYWHVRPPCRRHYCGCRRIFHCWNYCGSCQVDPMFFASRLPLPSSCFRGLVVLIFIVDRGLFFTTLMLLIFWSSSCRND